MGYSGSFSLGTYLPKNTQRIAYDLSGAQSKYLASSTTSGWDANTLYDAGGNYYSYTGNDVQSDPEPLRPVMVCKLNF